jgi:hypothetical protein
MRPLPRAEYKLNPAAIGGFTELIRCKPMTDGWTVTLRQAGSSWVAMARNAQVHQQLCSKRRLTAVGALASLHIMLSDLGYRVAVQVA